MELSAVAALEPDQVRQVLPGFLASYITDPVANSRAVQAISLLATRWSDAEIKRLLQSLLDVGEEQRVYSAHPLARELSRVWAAPLLTEIQVSGVHHLRAAATAGPTAVLCNHTSYMDSSAIDTILAGADATDLADRILSAAGPKVYSSLFRRFAAMCLNTLPVPQSTSLGHTARLSPRELARLALQSMKLAHNSMSEGYILLIFPEGSRTRTGRLQPFLQGVYRYLAMDDLRVVPAALVGCNDIMDIETERCVPGSVSLTFGPPLQVVSRGDAKEVFNGSFDAISDILPQRMRPF